MSWFRSSLVKRHRAHWLVSLCTLLTLVHLLGPGMRAGMASDSNDPAASQICSQSANTPSRNPAAPVGTDHSHCASCAWQDKPPVAIAEIARFIPSFQAASALLPTAAPRPVPAPHPIAPPRGPPALPSLA